MTRAIAPSDLERTRNMPTAQAAAFLSVHPESLRRARRRINVSPDYALAERLLADHTPYPEVARTIGVPTSRVRRRFPGYAVSREHRSIMASILSDSRLRELHTELEALR